MFEISKDNTNPHIISHTDQTGREYFEIEYFDGKLNDTCVGFGSYSREYCEQWLKEYFVQEKDDMNSQINPKNNTMTFAAALCKVKNGYRIARKGWNGKNMCVYYTEGSTIPFSKCKEAVQNALISCRSEDIGNCTIKGIEPQVTINPHLDLVCADGTITCGWTASQTDMMAEDWIIVQ